ncbi:MAG: hypothetical protein HN975_06175 [Anaerolineae bacterium]|jgi:hypothetical protein|nr:hypothetical protein [Anaerolineae bacterium]
MSKPTKAELTQRVARISELLLRGASRAVICQYVSEKTDWGVTDRTVDRYIESATVTIKAGAETDLEYETGKAKERYEFLWNKALSTHDYREARGVQKDRSALLGLEAPKRTDITSAGKELKGYAVVNPDDWDDGD